jgi:hypothetical protein
MVEESGDNPKDINYFVPKRDGPKLGDPIPDDHKYNREEVLLFVEDEVSRLERLKTRTSEEEGQLLGYKQAASKLKKKIAIAEQEQKQLAPLRNQLPTIVESSSWHGSVWNKWIERGVVSLGNIIKIGRHSYLTSDIELVNLGEAGMTKALFARDQRQYIEITVRLKSGREERIKLDTVNGEEVD